MARRYSANTASAAKGGALEPFTKDDPNVPEGFREVAFSLELGKVSAPVRVGRWLHILRVEHHEPASNISIDEVSNILTDSIRNQKAEEAMESLFEELMEQADVQIMHPSMRQKWSASNQNSTPNNNHQRSSNSAWSD